jgi:hypothetical protein
MRTHITASFSSMAWATSRSGGDPSASFSCSCVSRRYFSEFCKRAISGESRTSERCKSRQRRAARHRSPQRPSEMVETSSIVASPSVNGWA